MHIASFLSLALSYTLACMLSGAVQADPPAGYVFHTYDKGLARAADSGKPVFVYFGREGCGYCDFTNKNAFSDPNVRERYAQNYELVYVDAESGKRLTLPSGERITERDLGTNYKAFVTPVFVFLSSDGSQIIKRIGVQQTSDLLLYDRYITGEHYKRIPFSQFSANDG